MRCVETCRTARLYILRSADCASLDGVFVVILVLFDKNSSKKCQRLAFTVRTRVGQACPVELMDELYES